LFFGFHTQKQGSVEPAWAQFRFVIFFFVEILSYSMIAVIFGLMIRKAGLAMGIFFLYMIMEQFVVGLGRNKYKVGWVDYLPEEVTDRLIPQPFAPRMMSPANTTAWEHHIPLYLSLAVIYLLVYIVFVSWRFRKNDL
ncbi:MAG TPA: hypothetical protein VGM24_06425, partial [Puia sp.]